MDTPGRLRRSRLKTETGGGRRELHSESFCSWSFILAASDGFFEPTRARLRRNCWFNSDLNGLFSDLDKDDVFVCLLGDRDWREGIIPSHPPPYRPFSFSRSAPPSFLSFSSLPPHPILPLTRDDEEVKDHPP